MKKFAIAITLPPALGIGSFAAVHAKLPPAPPKSDAEKAAEAEKAAAAKAKEAERTRQGAGQGGRQLQEEQGIVEPKALPARRGGFHIREEMSTLGPS